MLLGHDTLINESRQQLYFVCENIASMRQIIIRTSVPSYVSSYPEHTTYLSADGIEHEGVERGDVEVEHGEEDGLESRDDL